MAPQPRDATGLLQPRPVSRGVALSHQHACRAWLLRNLRLRLLVSAR